MPRRSAVRVRGDNVSMLTVVTDFKGRGPGLSLLARECGLLIAGAAYAPVDGEHLPGVANGLADLLSRRFDPRKSSPVGAEPMLSSAKEIFPARRDAAWFRALRVPTRVWTDAGWKIHWGPALD